MPGIANDIKKPGVEEHGYTKTPLRAADSMFRAYKVLHADLGRVTCPILLFRSTVDHVVDPSSATAIQAAVCPRPTSARSCSRTATTWPRSTTMRSGSSRARWPSSSASPASPRWPDRVVTTPAGPNDPDDEPGGGQDDVSSGVSADDAAWRSIVDNYGERPELEDRASRRADGADPALACGVLPRRGPGPGRRPTPRTTSCPRRRLRSRAPRRRGCSPGWACSGCPTLRAGGVW